MLNLGFIPRYFVNRAPDWLMYIVLYIAHVDSSVLQLYSIRELATP